MGPRASFVAFDQINRFRCRPWAEEDEASALALAELLEHVYGAERVCTQEQQNGRRYIVLATAWALLVCWSWGSNASTADEGPR